MTIGKPASKLSALISHLHSLQHSYRTLPDISRWFPVYPGFISPFSDDLYQWCSARNTARSRGRGTRPGDAIPQKAIKENAWIITPVTRLSDHRNNVYAKKPENLHRRIKQLPSELSEKPPLHPRHLLKILPRKLKNRLRHWCDLLL